MTSGKQHGRQENGIKSKKAEWQAGKWDGERESSKASRIKGRKAGRQHGKQERGMGSRKEGWKAGKQDGMQDVKGKQDGKQEIRMESDGKIEG